jgi:hypothetical protein
MYKRALRWWMWGWAAALLSACAPFAPQRMGVGPQDICSLPAGSAQTLAQCQEASLERAANFDIAYVEMTDQGWFQLRAQSERAFALIDAARASGKDVQVVLFVHGWRHSAAFDDLDARNFREVVMPAFAAAHPERHNIGIYVGWRAQSIDMPVLERFSFWDRKAAAEHVSRGSIRELIGRLRHQHVQSQHRVHVSLIGHSFGGLIVFNSIAESLMDTLIATAPGRTPAPMVDLALVLNPAFEASRFDPLFQVARRLPAERAQMHARPIFVSITSEADSATKTVFPIGRSLNSMFGRKRWTDEDDCPGGRDRAGDCPGGDPDTMLERVAISNTVGHIDRYLTHRLDASEPGAEIHCQRDTRGQIAATRAFPLWTFRTSANVMNAHHDIYRPALWRLVVGLADGKAPAGC